ncbi:MAG TPA: metal-dependent hydrolase [Candidatus Binatia bacterium]|nr:metal-dependent hydrolase [Candidatus Binatia bacterium]
MTGRTHDLAAITALGAIVIFEPLRLMTLSTVIASILANQIGGITPDIDQPTAPLWNNLPAGKIFGKAFDMSMGGHRFLTHSILGLGLFGFLAHFFIVFIHPLIPHVNIGLVWWSFMVGMLSHLVMDSFTKEGVPWLLPIPVRFGFPPTKSLRIITGGKIELFVVFPGLLVIDIWLVASHYDKLLMLIHQYIH